MSNLTLLFRLLRLAKTTDVKYLQGLNLQALQKERGKPPQGSDPRAFYEALQREALKGPLFAEATLKFMDSLDLDLQKDEAKWLATRFQKKAKIDPTTLQNVLDYLRSEKPDLNNLKYQQAVENSRVWHEQFTAKPKDSAGPYSTHDVVLKVDNGHEWVNVPAEDCKVEGDLMGHCVGSYAPRVKKGSIKILSLRDAKDQPHVTVEVARGKIQQIQGKQNTEPVGKYHSAVEKLIAFLKIPHNKRTLKYVSDPATLKEWSESKSVEQRANAAKSKNTPPEVLSRLVTDKSQYVVFESLKNPSTPEDVLRKLFRKYIATVGPDTNYLEMNCLSRNPNLPTDLLKELANSKKSFVRALTTRNPRVPEALLLKLASDSNDDVRLEVAESPYATSKVLMSFVGSSLESKVAMRIGLPDDVIVALLQKSKRRRYVLELLSYQTMKPDTMLLLAKTLSKLGSTYSENLAANRNITPEIIHVLLLQKRNGLGARRALAGNPKTPVDILRKFSEDKERIVRSTLVSNESTPLDVLKTLTQDKDDSVSSRARFKLKERTKKS